MSASHTPGPWEFVTKWCDQVTSNDGCICIPTQYNSNGVSRTKLEIRANARLIAAAPELLAALIAFEAFGNTMGVRKQISAAIAKSTGAAS